MQLSRVVEREFPPQNRGVGIGMKWIIMPSMFGGGDEGK